MKGPKPPDCAYYPRVQTSVNGQDPRCVSHYGRSNTILHITQVGYPECQVHILSVAFQVVIVLCTAGDALCRRRLYRYFRPTPTLRALTLPSNPKNAPTAPSRRRGVLSLTCIRVTATFVPTGRSNHERNHYRHNSKNTSEDNNHNSSSRGGGNKDDKGTINRGEPPQRHPPRLLTEAPLRPLPVGQTRAAVFFGVATSPRPSSRNRSCQRRALILPGSTLTTPVPTPLPNPSMMRKLAP